MSFRPGPLITAAWLALSLVVVRVVYRAVFGAGAAAGASSGGWVLVDIPLIRLPEPLNHVTLFGPITGQGLVLAALSAVPLALTVLGFGLLNSVLDVPGLLARVARGGVLASLARALVLSFATLPTMRSEVSRVMLARRLRAARGPATVLVPMLERTVAGALCTAASMEVRGFGAKRPGAGRSGSGGLVVAAELAHNGGEARRFDLTLTGSSLTVLTGPTGSGKTLLLRALAGLLVEVDGGRIDGTVTVAGHDRRNGPPPREVAVDLGYVAQEVRESFVAATVADEIGFGLQVRGVPEPERTDAVARAARALGVIDLTGREPSTLSAGQAQRVALAAAMAHQPSVLLVDEPLADLDSESAATVCQVLRDAADGGACVVVTEHRAERLAMIADAMVHLMAPALATQPSPVRPPVPAPAPRGRTTGTSSPLVSGRPQSSASPTDRAVLTANGVSVRYGSHPALAPTNLSVGGGESLAILGPNGCGKSSLLTALALGTGGSARRAGGLVVSGSVDVVGTSRHGSTSRRHSRARADRTVVALVPDRSDDLLAALTIEEECRRNDRDGQLPRGRTAEFLSRLAPEVAAQPERHPRDLSLGQRRLLVIAIQSACGAPVLLLDEPTRGLDPAAAARVLGSLTELAATGTGLVVATHDLAVATWAHRTLALAAA